MTDYLCYRTIQSVHYSRPAWCLRAKGATHHMADSSVTPDPAIQTQWYEKHSRHAKSQKDRKGKGTVMLPCPPDWGGGAFWQAHIPSHKKTFK